MKIGITGGAGFIGGYVAECALSRGHEVVIFDRRGMVRPGVVHEGERLTAFMGDVRDPVAMAELAAHTDGIIHLAACLGTQETIRNPRPAAETNIVGGLNFLEACSQYDIPGVYIGVGNHWMDNTYSISKTTVERFVRMFNADRRPRDNDSLQNRFNIVRLVNAYGPRQSVAPPYGPAKVRKITPSFIARALTGAPIEIYGDGQQISDMVHVSDGALALVKALEAANNSIVFDRPVEVGSPWIPPKVIEVAKLVRLHARHLTGHHSEISLLPMRPGETVGTPVVADTNTLDMVEINPDDLVKLPDGIAETVAWYHEHWLPQWEATKAIGGLHV